MAFASRSDCSSGKCLTIWRFPAANGDQEYGGFLQACSFFLTPVLLLPSDLNFLSGSNRPNLHSHFQNVCMFTGHKFSRRFVQFKAKSHYIGSDNPTI